MIKPDPHNTLVEAKIFTIILFVIAFICMMYPIYDPATLLRRAVFIKLGVEFMMLGMLFLIAGLINMAIHELRRLQEK